MSRNLENIKTPDNSLVEPRLNPYRDMANEISTVQRFGLVEMPKKAEPNPYRDLKRVGQ